MLETLNCQVRLIFTFIPGSLDKKKKTTKKKTNFEDFFLYSLLSILYLFVQDGRSIG